MEWNYFHLKLLVYSPLGLYKLEHGICLPCPTWTYKQKLVVLATLSFQHSLLLIFLSAYIMVGLMFWKWVGQKMVGSTLVSSNKESVEKRVSLEFLKRDRLRQHYDLVRNQLIEWDETHDNLMTLVWSVSHIN